LLKDLQVEHLTIKASPQFGHSNLTKFSFANTFTLQVVHFNII